MTDFTKLTDYEVMEKYSKGHKTTKIECQHEMYRRYEKLFHKMKWNLVARYKKCHTMPYDEDIECYEHDAYEKMIQAMDMIDIKKIKTNPKTWKIYIQFWGYLNSWNRDIIHEKINIAKNETLTSFCVSDVKEESSPSSYLTMASLKATENIEEDFLKDYNKKVFWNTVQACLNGKFTPIQVKIWNTKEKVYTKTDETMPIKDVCSGLKLTRSEYTRNIKNMKATFDKEFEVQSTKLKW